VNAVQLHIIGPGRAGRSLSLALEARGWPEAVFFGRGDDLSTAGLGADAVIIATPDDAIGEVAAALPRGDAVVVHLAGSRGLTELGDHRRVGALHPLVALPDPETGSARLHGAWFATAGDPLVAQVVEALGGRSFEVADEDRASYHAAAVIASNHLVALLGQAERITAIAGVPFEAVLDLAEGSMANVRALGPAAALTGPAARGDEATIRRHLAAVGDDEAASYEALAAEARRLAGRPQPFSE
jgi:predicted short-subunit dehydrogenase-like oxidoreductase (DUF2520 family)